MVETEVLTDGQHNRQGRVAAAVVHPRSYRPDIDSLRALAVLPVVLFHAHVPGFPGGYVGVDVFFVISGYLISSILLRQVSQGRFSLISFYERRTRRILPALFVMVITVALLGIAF